MDISFNVAVLLAWALSGGLFYWVPKSAGVSLSFLTLPAWVGCGVLYLGLSKWMQKKI